MTYDSLEDYESMTHQEPPKRFVPVYKCRMCGVKILHHYRILEEDKEQSLSMMITSSCNLDPYSGNTSVNYRSSKDLIIHKCEDGKLGVAELIGLEEFVEEKG